MVKVFTTNKNGKIEFTKEELERILNEVWQDGYNSHAAHLRTSTTITNPCRTASSVNTIGITTITCNSEETDKEDG